MFRLMMLMLGPITMGHDLLLGNADEGRHLPGLIARTREGVREVVGRSAKILTLLDAAFFERDVIAEMETSGWDFIVCANQRKDSLQRLAEEQPADQWRGAGLAAVAGRRLCAYADGVGSSGHDRLSPL